MFLGRKPRASRAKSRKTNNQKQQRVVKLFVALFLGVFASVFALNSLAEIFSNNDVELGLNTTLTYYLTVQEDGVDVDGVESSDTQMANVASGRINVTDRIPDGLVFKGFVTTADGKIGAVSRADSSVACSGRVVDDTNESIVDAGTWNNGRTEYYYHGLHYDVATRTVSFKVEKLKAGCELTVGIVTKTPVSVDIPDTWAVETRRDFYNNALASEKDLTAISNTVHGYIQSEETATYPVTYAYTGDVPAGAPAAPSAQSYAEGVAVAVASSPTLAGYTFSGWTTSDVTVEDGSFDMPDQAVNLVGIWVEDIVTPTYTVTYTINGTAPSGFLTPAPKSYAENREVTLDDPQTGAIIDGYRFLGWTTTDATISGGTGFTMPANDVVLTGSFERVSYTVCYGFEGTTLPPNANSLLPACTNHYPGDTVTTAAAPTAEGYEFTGWYKNASFIMPEKNVVIRGEWSFAPAGKFAPTITKVILDPKNEYMYGETVEFKITITNTAEYPIRDVYISELLDGAIIENSPTDSYSIVGNNTASIQSIAAGASVDIFASYKVTQNVDQTLTNTVKLTGALADNNYTLDLGQDYTASAPFTTVAEPAPFTGIIDNAAVHFGLVVVALTGFLAYIILSGKYHRAVAILQYIKPLRFNARRKMTPIRIACGALAMLLISGAIIRGAMAENYTEVIKSVSLTSAHTSYTNSESGAWNVTKSAEWIGSDTARIALEVDTVAKIRDNSGVDVVLVVDTSGSMTGEKIERMRSDVSEFVEEIINSHNGRAAIISFSTAATIQSGLTDNLDDLSAAINSLTAGGETNYYAGLTKANEVLANYQGEADRKLALLFLTDGYPTIGTPNEQAEYRILKAAHPNLLISGIQYEMDDSILEPVIQISDQQFLADIGSLDNALVTSLYEPIAYNDFILTDYIENNYWEVVSSSSISATAGDFELTNENGNQIVTWDLSSQFNTGASATLMIDVQLKDNIDFTQTSYLPTNTHESVVSTLVDTPNENVVSTNTPVLKARYNITYDANLPSGCNNYGGTMPQNGSYGPLTVVLVPADAISCDGYNFVGWQDSQGRSGILNGDYVRLMNDDLDLKALWTKVSIEKSMDGSVHDGNAAQLDTGTNINLALKELSGQIATETNDGNDVIEAIKSASSMSAQQQANSVIISSPDSEIPIYAWFDSNENAIYIYSEAGTIKGNPDMSHLFEGFGALNDASGVADWDMHETINLDSALATCGFLDLDDFADWDVSGVQRMENLLYVNWQLLDISGLANWDTSSVKTLSGTFSGTERITDLSPLANWDVSNVTDMWWTFYGIMAVENLDALANWDVSNVEDMDHMFGGARSLTNIDGLANWNTSKVGYMGWMFSESSLADVDALANWDTSNVTDMGFMFTANNSLVNVDGLANWNTSNVTSMYGMFYQDENLADLSGLADWDTSKVTDMTAMFHSVEAADLSPLADWDTSSVVDMSQMFFGTGAADVDALADWDTSSVRGMQYMFGYAQNLADLSGLADWDTGSVETMNQMFRGTGAISNIDALADWDTSSVTDMQAMFYDSSALSDVSGASGWDVSSVTDMSYMFAGDDKITLLTVLNNWDTSSVLEKGNMFDEIPSSVQRPSWWDLP